VDYSKLDDATLISLIEREHTEALSALYTGIAPGLQSGLALAGESGHSRRGHARRFYARLGKGRMYRADKAKVSTWLASIARHPRLTSCAGKARAPNKAACLDGSDRRRFVSADGPEEVYRINLSATAGPRCFIGRAAGGSATGLAPGLFQWVDHREIAESWGGRWERLKNYPPGDAKTTPDIAGRMSCRLINLKSRPAAYHPLESVESLE